MSLAAELSAKNDNPPGAAAAPATAETSGEPSLTVIEPRPGWQLLNLREMWRYRELLWILTWRDVKVRYKQTVLGAAWAILQPLATMVVFSLFVGRLVDGVPGGVPYPLFAFAGLLPWMFVANAVASAGNSVIGNQSLVTKVYFPRLLIPVSAAGAALVDLIVAFGMLVVLMAYYGVAPGPGVVMLPAVLVLLVTTVLGASMLLAALTVAYRDFRYVIPFMVQFGLFATPCIYLDAATVVGPVGRLVLPLNPAFGLILNLRAALLGGSFDWYALGVSAAVGVGLLVLGSAYFRRVERTFADIV